MTQIKEILKNKIGKIVNNFGFEMDGQKVIKYYLGNPKLTAMTDEQAILENSVEQFKLDFENLHELHFEIDGVDIIALYSPDYKDERFIITNKTTILHRLFEDEWTNLLLNEFPFDENEEDYKLFEY